MHRAQEGSFALPSWRQNIYVNYLEFLSFIYLFIRSFICIYIDSWILLYSLDYNPTLFFCSDCPSFYHWELFQLAPVSLWHISIIVGFVCLGFLLSPSLISGTLNIPSLSHIFAIVTPKSTITPRFLVPFIGGWY